MLKVYKSPEGYTFQFEEGTQPDGYVLLEPKKPAKAKQAKPANKAKKAETK